MLIKEILHKAQSILNSVSSTALLDAEVLLSHLLHKDRSYLKARPERILTPEQVQMYDTLLQRRQRGEPIAYITGIQEFWSLPLQVSNATLVPRADTELLVEILLEIISAPAACVADLGTGTGAIALALAKERPQWKIWATDKSTDALNIAKNNAKSLDVNNVNFLQGDWCQALPNIKFDCIVSNPPYIKDDDLALKTLGVCCEPRAALVSGKDGLEAIKMIIGQARNYLIPHGKLLLEHGNDQAEVVKALLHENSYHATTTYVDYAGQPRATMAQF